MPSLRLEYVNWFHLNQERSYVVQVYNHLQWNEMGRGGIILQYGISPITIPHNLHILCFFSLLHRAHSFLFNGWQRLHI